MLWDIVSWPVRLFGGLLAACLAAVFLLRLPVLSASGSSGLSESGGSGSGREEDAPGSADIRTPDGSYALTGEVLDQLPPDSVQLGVLFQEGQTAGPVCTPPAGNTQGVFCGPPRRDLYLQLPGGGYARACPEPG